MVDYQPGSYASGSLGGGNGGERPPHRSNKGKGPAGHQAEFSTPQERTIETISQLDKNFREAKYLLEHASEFPVQRQIRLRPNKRLGDFQSHVSYHRALHLYMHGELNRGEDRCERCKNGSGPFAECVSFPTDRSYPGRKNAPFKGACAGCYYGGQGSRCSMNEGYQHLPPRMLRANLLQGKYSHTHIGSRHDLDTEEGCNSAAQELQGQINALKSRRTLIKNSKEFEAVVSEGEVDSTEDEDVNSLELDYEGDGDELGLDFEYEIPRDLITTRSQRSVIDRFRNAGASDLDASGPSSNAPGYSFSTPSTGSHIRFASPLPPSNDDASIDNDKYVSIDNNADEGDSFRTSEPEGDLFRSFESENSRSKKKTKRSKRESKKSKGKDKKKKNKQ